MLFVYKALSQDGQLTKGQLHAADTAGLEENLRTKGLELLSARKALWQQAPRSCHLSRRELLDLCFHLEHLLRAGVPILESLQDLSEALEHGPLRHAVALVVGQIRSGQTLSLSMHGLPQFFPPLFINLIRAGELSGRLPEALSELAANLKWEDELISQTRKILIYPAIAGGSVLGVSAFLLIHLVPQLKVFISSMGQTLPLHSRLLFTIAEILADAWPWMLAISITSLCISQLAIQRSARIRLHWDRHKLSLPILGKTLHKIHLARVARTLALLYASGIPVTEAIRTTREVASNRALEQALHAIEKSIAHGNSIADSFATSSLFPPLVIRMLRIGENSGNLDLALQNLAYLYDRDVHASVAKVQAMIEPILTLSLGLLLGWIMSAVIGPIYDTIGQLKP